MAILSRRHEETSAGTLSLLTADEPLHAHDGPCDGEVGFKRTNEDWWCTVWVGDSTHTQRMFDMALEYIRKGVDPEDAMCEYDEWGQPTKG